MDIKDVGASVKGPSRQESPSRLRSGSPLQGEVEPTSTGDFFENSGRLGRVRALIDGLVQAPEIRTDLVERAKDLLQSGGLDGPESAARAAKALLQGAPGLSGDA